MDLISEKKLRGNILKWYPIEKESTILQVGYIPKEIVEELCEKSNKVTIILYDENQKKDIQNKVKKDNLELQIVTDLLDFSDKQYDYVTLIGTIETYKNKIEEKAYKRLEIFLDFAKDHCKDSGKILLVVDNKYGMKSWTTLRATKNVICNQTYALSKTQINTILKEKELINYKYYYTLPDYKATNVIFTDEYLPNLESINRNFLYGEEEFENFNQTEAYIELLKENPKSFDFYTNSYFIEIGKKQLNDNDIRFVSYTNIRKDKYKIQTIIYNDKVEKTYANEEAKTHIDNIIKNIDIMNNNNINTLDKYENGKIISKYVGNVKSYDKILIELLENNKKEEFFNSINQYKNNILEKLEKVDYLDIKDNNIFTKYNIECSTEILQEMYFVKYGMWDLIFQNTFYINGELYFYDQEWFDYNVPIEFIIYRAIAYFPSAHSFIKTEELYKKLGLEKYLDIFQRLDEELQNQIRDNNIWKQHLRTQTGQTLLNLYNNLLDEFDNYKKKYNFDDNKRIADENQELIKKNQDLENKTILLNEKIDKIYNSTSWKITKPMRWIKKNINIKKLGGK